MEFKENLKRLRKKKNLTQREFGKLIGKSELAIRCYESGKTTPPLYVLKEMGRALDVPINELIDAEEKVANEINKNALDLGERILKLNKKEQKIIKLLLWCFEGGIEND